MRCSPTRLSSGSPSTTPSSQERTMDELLNGMPRHVAADERTRMSAPESVGAQGCAPTSPRDGLLASLGSAHPRPLVGGGPSSARRKLVLVGNGMAGMRAIEELLQLEPNLYDITVFGAEPHSNYNRILLSPVLAAEKTIADIMLNTRDWYAERGITLIAGDEVVKIDRARRRVIAR